MSISVTKGLHLRLSLSAVLLAAIPALFTATGAWGGGDTCSAFPCGNHNQKVLICHVPPGNPANAHTICISPHAVPAHLGNHEGDHCGPCVAGGLVYAGDVSGDGLVDVTDLVQLIVSWGGCPDEQKGCPSDLDEDGQVDTSDFLIVMMNWD